MKWRVLILPKAENDLAWFRQHDRTNYVKCFDFVRELAQNPHQGTGKPERLKHFDQEVWSRRVSQEDRMVYVIYSEEALVEVVSCKSHYDFSL